MQIKENMICNCLLIQVDLFNFTRHICQGDTREELLVKSLDIYLKTVYHADSYNVCST